jgi:hypothetical protein
MNMGAEDGAMPANVSDRVRAMVAAGLAKLVDDVNQWAPPIQAPSANGMYRARPVRTQPWINSSRVTVATTSENSWSGLWPAQARRTHVRCYAGSHDGGSRSRSGNTGAEGREVSCHGEPGSGACRTLEERSPLEPMSPCPSCESPRGERSLDTRYEGDTNQMGSPSDAKTNRTDIP